MNRKGITCVLAAIVLAILMAATAYGVEASQPLAQRYDIHGYSIAYSENKETIFQNYGKDINEKSVFELASNGKVVGAYIALKLVDEGKISLDEKIAPYLKSDLLTDDTRMKDITLRQLLCHTAGFSPSFELGIDKKLYSEPGAEFRYSGVGYIYLQSVIEEVSGMTLEQVAKHYVFEPLGMQNTTFEKAKIVTPYMKLSSAVLYALAVFVAVFLLLVLIALILGKITKFRLYSVKGAILVCIAISSAVNLLFLLFVFVSKVVFLFLIYLLLIGIVLLITRKKNIYFYISMPILTLLILILSFIVPASIPVTNDLTAKASNCAYTLKSTSEDMDLFCGELMRQYNQGSETMRTMFMPSVEIDSANSWGLGIAIELEDEGETYWHSGINPGFQSLLVLYPQKNKYIIVLTNSDDGLDFSKDAADEFLSIGGNWNIKR